MPKFLQRQFAILILLGLGGIGWLFTRKEPNPWPQSRPSAQPVRQEREPRGASGEVIQGRVVGVSDGDTVTVLDSNQVQFRIRLLGIDAPEKAQPYGKVAKQVLSDRIFGKEVEVRVQGRDRYKRVLGKILLEGRDQNLLQVQEGLAWHYKHYSRNQFPGDSEEYARAEEKARREAIGLWRDPNPTPPWDWRKAKRHSD